MPVEAPVKRDLSAWRRSSNIGPDHQQGDDRIHYPQEAWEISAPESNSLFWSLMCPYLIKSSASGNFCANIEHITGTMSELSEGLEKLKITAKPNIQKVENRVKNINPFKNAHTLYYDKDLITLMRVFKKRLNQLANELKKEGKTYDDNLKIQAASTAFCCQIDLYEDYSGNKDVRIFLPNSKFNQPFTLIIFKYKTKNSENSSYKMGFGIDYSQDLRIKALKHILPSANVHSQKIQTIVDSTPSDKFLHHLLAQGSNKEAILMLYESFYTLKKLNDAGYDVDPLSIGPDGFSAFYHCIRLNDWELLILLYNYVTKDASTQKSTEMINRLKNIKEVLNRDCNNSQNFLLLSSKQTEALLMFSQIQLIIKFQCEVFENIISTTNSALLEPDEKHNRIMIFVLDKYEEYFYLKSHKGDSQYNQFLDYVQYYNYHKYIEEFTFFLFCDNFLSLTVPESDKNTFLLKNSLIYLLEYLISKKIFRKRSYIGSTNESSVDNEKELFVPFCYRMKLKNTLSTLFTELTPKGEDKTNSSNKNIETMNILIHCLKKHPALEEEFQITRFKEYLKIGGNISFENSAAPFAIERALQVIGETLKTIRDDSVVTPLLKYSFPPNLKKLLCDVRNNCLAHLRISYAQGRKELEKSDILKKIQTELNTMAERFEAIFMLQTLRVKNHMIEYSIEESEAYPDHIKSNLADVKSEISMLKRNFLRNHKDMYLTISYKIITSLIGTLQTLDASKMENVQRDYNSLKFLIALISEHCSESTAGIFNNELQKIKTCKIDNQNEDLLNAFLSLKQKFEGYFKNSANLKDEIDLSNMSALFDIIKRNDFFTAEEGKKIKKSLFEYFEKPERAKQQLIDHSNRQVNLTDDEIKRLIKEIIASEKIKKDITKNLLDSDKVMHLLKKVNLGDFFEKDEDFFIDFVHILSDDKFRHIFLNLFLPQKLHFKIANLRNQKLEFLRERMNLLEKILIVENTYISNLKKYGTSPECKDYVKRLILLRYMEEKDTRAALETLLLDCLEMINKKTRFQDLFTKTSNFFSGANLRNFLSHGCPIFEIANDHLTPNNLPREMIETILKLIDDQKGLEAIIHLWKETNNAKISKLKTIILDTSSDNYSDTRETIKKCDKWESYLQLLPIK